MDLDTPLALAGPALRIRAKQLSKLGINTIGDMLFYLPYRYEDSSVISPINILQRGEQVTIKGYVTSVATVRTKRGLSIQNVTVSDRTGKIICVFFNQKYILNVIHKEDFVSIAGRVEKFGSRLSLMVKSYEKLEDENATPIHTGRLVPVYSQAGGLYSKWVRGRIKSLLSLDLKIKDFMPKTILAKNNLIDLPSALYKIHFPKNLKEAQDAHNRLSFDELFLKHSAAILRKKEWESKQKAVPFEFAKHKNKIDNFIKNLPFKLTASQKKAVEEISSDLTRNIPMNRLLEGDVGSGKTVVAAIAVYLCFLNGFQSAFMAPTEILANQHFETIQKLLERFGVKTMLFTSSTKSTNKVKAKKRNSKFETPNSGDFDVAVGTHALLEKKIEFKNLGLIIIDEQQRFGVQQRAILHEKGVNPHLLTMTATPIPRTIFLTIYADLSLSYLSQMPAGRKKIKTWLVPEEKRAKGYKWIADKIKNEKSQVFVVCPFIEPSETLTSVKAAKEEFEHLQKDVFQGFKLGLLHGKMKSDDKKSVIEGFRKGSINILVATPVIEVGIDIPTADIILIEAAERFGLAQLHQLRGRVGRGEKESYCLLFSGSESEKTQERLIYLQTVDNGAELAEIDLKLRGPGEMFGTAQSGIPDLKIASLSDAPIIASSRKQAEEIFGDLKKYPELLARVKQTEIPKISKD